MNSLELNSFARWGLNLLALLGFIVALRLGAVIFIPTIIALILAAMLWPIVRWLNQWLPWGVTCLLVVISTILPIVIVTAGFSVAIPRMLQGLPDPRNPEGQKELYSDIRKQVERLSPTFLDEIYWPVEAEKSVVFKSVEATLQNKYVQDTMLRFMPDALIRVATFGIDWVCQWVLILFQLLFLLLEGRLLTRRVAELVGPTADLQARAVTALTDMAFQVRNFLLWRTLVNIGLGLIVGGVYHVLGLREPWTWALLTMVLCYVPYLGPIVAGVPPIFDAFLHSPEPWYALLVLLFYIGIVTLEGYVVVPVVMGRSMELNATTVMLACLFWDVVWGLPGLFLAMPLMAVIKTICWHMPETRPWANLMSLAEGEPREEKPEPPPETKPPVPEVAVPSPPVPVVEKLEEAQGITR